MTLGSGNDTVEIGGSHDVIAPGTGSDVVSGTQGMACITTGGGNDTSTAGGRCFHDTSCRCRRRAVAQRRDHSHSIGTVARGEHP